MTHPAIQFFIALGVSFSTGVLVASASTWQLGFAAANSLFVTLFAIATWRD